MPVLPESVLVLTKEDDDKFFGYELFFNFNVGPLLISDIPLLRLQLLLTPGILLPGNLLRNPFVPSAPEGLLASCINRKRANNERHVF